MASGTKEKLVGVYGIIRGLLALLLGLALTILGSVLGSIPISGAGSAGGLAVILGILYFLAALAVWASAYGLFTDKDWAPMTTTIGFGVLFLLVLFSMAQTGDIGALAIVFLVLDAASVVVGALNWDAIPIGESGAQRRTPT